MYEGEGRHKKERTRDAQSNQLMSEKRTYRGGKREKTQAAGQNKRREVNRNGRIHAQKLLSQKEMVPEEAGREDMTKIKVKRGNEIRNIFSNKHKA